MADTSLGFRFRYRLSGGPPTIQKLITADTGTLTRGDLVNLESGEVDLAASGDAAMVGAVNETKATVDSTTTIEVITDSDAVYGVYDPNARAIGDTLDISGTTGAMTVAASGDADLTVVADSTASEETLVMITPGEHWLHP